MSKSNQSGVKKGQFKQAHRTPGHVTPRTVASQGVLREHGEKLILGIVGLVALVCTWSALRHQPYDKTPADLANLLEQRRAAVQRNTPESSELLASLEVKDYSKLALKSVERVGPLDRLPTVWVCPFWACSINTKRGAPELYPAEAGQAFPMLFAVAWDTLDGKPAPGKPAAKVKGKAGAVGPVGPPGAAPMPAPPVKGVQVLASTDYRALECVMIVFRVPRGKESEAFRRAFELVRGYQPSRDIPNYLAFWIERKTDNGPWEDSVAIDTPGGRKRVSFAEAYEEVQKHFPVGFPEIVDTAQEDCVIPFDKGMGFTASPLPPILGEDFDARAAGGFPMKQPAAQAVPVAPNAPQGIGGVALNPFAPRPGAAPLRQGVRLSDILLRFFDVTVEEGHAYQYRVQVALRNPNHKLVPSVLNDRNLAKEEFLFTPWSEPTEPVRVTIGGSEVIAGPVRPARVESGVADSATAILRQRDRAKGALVAHTFRRLEAGQVLNFQVKDAKEIKFEKPVGGVDALPQFDFRSDNLVLDLRGGGDRGWPGEMLLLDAGGRLVVQSEIGQSNPRFAEESSRLESIYSRQAPPPAGAGGFGDPAFDFGGARPVRRKKKP